MNDQQTLPKPETSEQPKTECVSGASRCSTAVCGESIRVMHPLFQVGQGGSIPTSPLQLRLEQIDLRLAMQLNRLWHSVLPATHYAGLKAGNHTVAYAAVCGRLIYAVAIWTDPVNRTLANGTTIELRRLAIAPDAPRYTASRLLGVMCRLIRNKWPELLIAVSYQACAVHSGTIYKAAGWLNAAYSKFTPWKKRKTRTRDGVFQHKSSDRSPPQIESDKIRWERRLR